MSSVSVSQVDTSFHINTTYEDVCYGEKHTNSCQLGPPGDLNRRARWLRLKKACKTQVHRLKRLDPDQIRAGPNCMNRGWMKIRIKEQMMSIE